MALNMKKGLFRTYIAIDVLLVIWGFAAIQFSGEYFDEVAPSVLMLCVAPWLMHFIVLWIIKGFKTESKTDKETKAHNSNPDNEVYRLKLEKKVKYARRNCTAGWIIGSITIFSFFAPATSINPNWSIGDKIAVLAGLSIFPIISLLVGIFTFLRLKNLNTILLIAYSIVLIAITSVRSLISQ